MLFHLSPKAFNYARVVGDSDASLSFYPDRPTNALWGKNLNCMVASPVGQCYSSSVSPNKFWLHVARHCPAVKAEIVAWERLQRGRRSRSCTLLLSHCPLKQSTVILPMRNASPDHNDATPKPISFLKARVGKALTAWWRYRTWTIRAKKSEAILICKKDSSLLPHWKCVHRL